MSVRHQYGTTIFIIDISILVGLSDCQERINTRTCIRGVQMLVIVILLLPRN